MSTDTGSEWNSDRDGFPVEVNIMLKLFKMKKHTYSALLGSMLTYLGIGLIAQFQPEKVKQESFDPNCYVAKDSIVNTEVKN